MKKIGLLLGLLLSVFLFSFYRADEEINLKSFKVLPLNEIKPEGWLKNQILRDMKEGYFSVLDEMQPTLKHGVFGPEKVTNFSIDRNGDYTIRKATWWWGEHEGFWADAIIRSAFLTGDKKLIQKADSIVHYVLSNQEEDGYIGIYKKGHRLDLIKGENGELWTQSRILGALLAYYEFTGKKEVLKAVERAAGLTMSHYGPGKSYFQVPKTSGGGTSHGLSFAETMEMLYRITGNKKYADFGIWLYNDYSNSRITINRDNQLENLLKKDELFKEHGAHILEHMRVVLWMSTLSRDPGYSQAFNNLFYKLDKSTVPGGAMVSDEMVKQRLGDPNLFYEFCTMTERTISTFSGLQKSGRTRYADEIENVVFNAAQGARLSDMSATSYCSRDNREMAVPIDGNFRFRYSANHDPACCNLNAGRLYPYFVSNLWMKTQDEKGFVATAYGPSILTSSIKGNRISINEVTSYPFENNISFKITVEKPVKFSVIFRKPGWADKAQVDAGDASISFREGYYIVTKKWKTGDQISVSFDSPVKATKALNGEVYLKKGALVYSLPIKEHRDTIRTFKKGFYALDMVPENKTLAEQIFKEYKLVPDSGNNSSWELTKNPLANPAYPWDVPYYQLKAKFDVGGEERTELLYPMGSTVLRKLTFPLK